MNKLKNVTVVPHGEEFQVIGNYKIIGETRFDDTQYLEAVIYSGKSYTDAKTKGRTLAHACNCGFFDIVELNASVPLVESYAKMNNGR